MPKTRDAIYTVTAVKSAGLAFLSGKAITAFVSAALLLLLIRVLGLEQFGAYTALIAGMEILLALGGFGLPWIGARYLPEYLLKGDKSQLTRFIAQLLVGNSLGLLVAVLAIFACGEWLLASIRLDKYSEEARLVLGLAVIEGTSRFVQEGVLAPLLSHRFARTASVLRQTLFLLAVTALSVQGTATLHSVIAIELVASFVGLAIALHGAHVTISQLPSLKNPVAWRAAPLSTVWATGLRMYVVHLLTLLYSPQFAQLCVQKVLGTDAGAVFGFLRMLHGQVARFLPATLLFTVIRPKITAAFIADRDMTRVSLVGNTAGKLSLVVLTPLLALSAVAGEDLVLALSGARIADSGSLLFGFFLTLVPLSQRQLIEAIAVSCDRSDLVFFASLVGIVMLPLMPVAVYCTKSIWGALFAIAVGHFAVNHIVQSSLARRNGYRRANNMLGYFGPATSVGALAGLLVPSSLPLALELICVAAIVTVVAGTCLWIRSPFDQDEIAFLRKFGARGP